MRDCIYHTVQVGQDSQAPMLQLPHMDMDIIKKLGRKRVRSLGELLILESEERLTLLKSCGESTLSSQWPLQQESNLIGHSVEVSSAHTKVQRYVMLASVHGGRANRPRRGTPVDEKWLVLAQG